MYVRIYIYEESDTKTVLIIKQYCQSSLLKFDIKEAVLLVIWLSRFNKKILLSI